MSSACEGILVTTRAGTANMIPERAAHLAVIAPTRARNGREGASRLRVLNADSIAIHWGSAIEVIRWADVILARSVKNCTEIATRDRTLRVHSPLKGVLSALAGLGLIQIRRDTAVNEMSVRRLIGAGRHRLLVILEGGACLRVGRDFQRDVRARFGTQS